MKHSRRQSSRLMAHNARRSEHEILQTTGSHQRHERSIPRGSWTDEVHEVHKILTGKLATRRKNKGTGACLQGQIVDAIKSASIAHPTRVLDWTRGKTLVLVAQARKEVENDRRHLHFCCHCLRGKKVPPSGANTSLLGHPRSQFRRIPVSNLDIAVRHSSLSDARFLDLRLRTQTTTPPMPHSGSLSTLFFGPVPA